MLLLSMIISVLALGALSQSKLEAYFARNVLENLTEEEAAYQGLYQAEVQFAEYKLSGPAVQLIAYLPNSLNYFDRGGTDIAKIAAKAGSLRLVSVWWQRRADQFHASDIQKFLAKDGRFYQLSVQYRPLRLEFNGRTIFLPKGLSRISRPLLVNLLRLDYADRLYLVDNESQIWFVDLSLIPSQWHLVKLGRLLGRPLLDIPLWASLSENDQLELYIATKQGIEAWRASDQAKPLWLAKVPGLNAFFLEGKRLWYVKESGFRLKIGALNRLTGQTLPSPLFYREPEQTEFEFDPKNADYNWRLVPDNIKKIETLYFAGAEILLDAPKYETGRQRLQYSN